MSYAARIQDGIVAEVIQLPNGVALADAFHPDSGFVAAVETTTVGMTYANGQFGPAPDPEPIVAPVPASISDRQFAQQLAVLGTITEAEALAWAARGDLPEAMEIAVAGLAAEARFSARMLLSAATSYERGHPLVPAVGALLGYDAAQIDDLWRAAALL